jgi:hypothetical protein
MESESKVNQKSIYKHLILPLITGFECGGFFIFGSPIIYIQGLDEEVPTADLSGRGKSANIDALFAN